MALGGGFVVAIVFASIAVAALAARLAWHVCVRPRREDGGVGDREGDLCFSSSNVLV